MVRTNRFVTLSVITAFLLAGCTGAKQSPASLINKPQSTVGVDSADMGRIVGLVTDEESIPIAEAQVGLQGAGKALVEAVTDASGGFTILGIEPGQYTLLVTKLGFVANSQAVDVKAGETNQATIKLQALASTAPYAKTQSQQGYIQCTVRASPGFPAWVPNPFGGNILAPGWYTGLAACAVTCDSDLNPKCVPVFPPDKFNLFYDLNETGVNELLIEMSWQSSQALGKGMSIVLEADKHVNDGTPVYGSTGGMSPIRAYANAAKVQEVWKADKIDCSTAKIGAGCKFGTRVFANANTTNFDAPAEPPAVPLFGAPPKRVDLAWIMDQKFDEYLTFFHNGMVKPADFTALH